MTPGPTIYTIGHSTRSLEDFVELLTCHGVKQLVDVRTLPTSKRHPHFTGEALAQSLPHAGIDYRWLKGLGGRRRPQPDSLNTGWRNESFRGYADHMQSPEFVRAVEELMERGYDDDLAIMCAEAVPWRCHRSLIGDALVVRGARVLDIMTAHKAPAHKLTPFAQVEGTKIIYPPVT